MLALFVEDWKDKDMFGGINLSLSATAKLAERLTVFMRENQ